MNPHLVLQNQVREADLDGLRQSLEFDIPSLSKEEQLRLCVYRDNECPNVPCLDKIQNLAEAAVKASQLTVFEYLWDTFLMYHSGIALSWPMLEWAAEQGSIAFAESFHNRDPQCFKILSPYLFRGPSQGRSQITSALGHDQFRYVDYMLEHGAHIDNAAPYHNIVGSVIRRGGPTRRYLLSTD